MIKYELFLKNINVMKILLTYSHILRNGQNIEIQIHAIHHE